MTCDGVQYNVLSRVSWFVQEVSWQWTLALTVLAGGQSAELHACVCVRVCVFVCHVRFSSSVNVVDYFLRDQNWLPRIRLPSIFSRSNRMREGLGRGNCMKQRLMGKTVVTLLEQLTKQSGNSLLNLPSAVNTLICHRNIGEKENVMLWHYLLFLQTSWFLKDCWMLQHPAGLHLYLDQQPSHPLYRPRSISLSEFLYLSDSHSQSTILHPSTKIYICHLQNSKYLFSLKKTVQKII